MKKPADAQYPIHELLRQRWSPLAFSDHAVEPDKLRSVLEAARWAPSSYNAQPWSFLIATQENSAEFERLLSCLVAGNQLWAQRAPVLMMTVARLQFEQNGKPNRHAFHDVGLAAANLSIQAGAHGLAVHQMAGILPERVREQYHVPEGWEPVAGLALGYPGEPDALPDKLRDRELSPRTRKPLDAFVFTGDWGHVSPLVANASNPQRG